MEFTTEAEPAEVSISITDIGETEATLTVTDNKGITGTRFVFYKVQEKSAPAPEGPSEFTDFLYTWDGNSATGTVSSLTPGTEYVVYAAIAYFAEGSVDSQTYTEMVSAEFTTKSGSEEPSESAGMSLSYRSTGSQELTTEKFDNYVAAVERMNGLDSSYTDVTLDLLGDITIEVTEDFGAGLEINRTCTLDLNGYTLRVDGARFITAYGIYLDGDLRFTLTDSSESQSGLLLYQSDYDGEAVRVGYPMYPVPEDKVCDVGFVMNGGNVKAINSSTGKTLTAISSAKFGFVNIVGGRIDGTVSINGDMEMSGGSIEAFSPTGVVSLTSTANFTMTGGEIHNTDTETALTTRISAVYTYSYINGDCINISGGTLSSINGPALCLQNNVGYSGSVHVSGNANLISENAAAIYYDRYAKPNGDEQITIQVEDSSLSGGTYAIEVVDDDPFYLTIDIGEGVSFRYPVDSIPVSPNGSYVDYPDGMVVNMTPTKTETVNGVEYATYDLIDKDMIEQMVGSEKIGYQNFDDLNTAINGATVLFERGNGDGIYSSELWDTFVAAYNSALPILENANANQNEIDYFATQLGRAQAEMISDAEHSLDLDNLADGSYTVNVEVYNATFSQLSMANGAVSSQAELTVKDGVGTITLTLKPIIQIGRWGSLMQFWTYNGDTPEQAQQNSNLHSGDLSYMTEATYTRWQRVDLNTGNITEVDGTPSERPTLENDIRPAEVSIKLPYIGNSGDKNKIQCYVGVDMMRSLGGVGDQPCILYIKYSTLKAVDVDATLSTQESNMTLLQQANQNIGATVTGDSGWTISYESSNSSVATVDTTGTVTAVGEGTCTITVSAAKDGADPLSSKTVEVTVAKAGATALQPVANGNQVTISGDTVVTNLEDVDVSDNRIVIDTETSSNQVSISMAAESVNALAASGKELTIVAGPGRIDMDAKLLAVMNQAGTASATELTFNKVSIPTFEDEDIKRSEFDAAYELKVTQGNSDVNFRNGQATVYVPWSSTYGYAYYVEDGELKDVQTMVPSNGMASWVTDHFSTWALSERGDLMEKVGIQEGVYSVPIRVKNAYTGQTSMMEDATGDMVVADVREDEVIYTMFLKARVGDELGGEPIRGHLIEMRYYHPDDTGRDNAIPAKVVRYYEDRDMYGKIDTFPREIEIEQEGEPRSQYYIWVAVDAMGGTSQPQDALVKLDWDNALDDGGAAAREGFEDEFAIEQVINSGEYVSRKDLKEWIDEEYILLVQGKDDDLTARFDTDALADIYGQTDGRVRFILEERKKSKLTDEQQEVVGDRPIYVLEITCGNDAVTEISDGTVDITFPYKLQKDEVKEGLLVWLVDEDGKIHEIKCSYSERGKTVSFDTTEFGTFVIAYDEDRIWENPFTDIKEEDWFFEAVKYVVQKGLFSGTSETTFEPNTTMTRGMLVTVLYRLTGSPEVKGQSNFTDVEPGKYYTNAVIWAVQNGIVSGYGNGLFGTNDIVSREQMATILFRYAKAKGYDTSLIKDIGGFTDSDQVASYAKRAMQWAYANGIIAGTSETTLSPKSSATRAQVAVILMRFDEKIVIPAQEKAAEAAKEADKDSKK